MLWGFQVHFLHTGIIVWLQKCCLQNTVKNNFWLCMVCFPDRRSIFSGTCNCILNQSLQKENHASERSRRSIIDTKKSVHLLSLVDVQTFFISKYLFLMTFSKCHLFLPLHISLNIIILFFVPKT